MKRKTMSPGDVYRAAARMLETREETFPCIAVGSCTPGGDPMDWYTAATLAGRFILAMAPLGDHRSTHDASDAYLRALPKGDDWDETACALRAHSIVALGFAAAMADTGDLP